MRGGSHHMVLWSIQAFLEENTMRITLALDDELLANAQPLTGMTEKSALVQEALRALIQRESARRLALLGGSEPRLTDIPRRSQAKAVLQEVASFEETQETLALLKILALGNQDVPAGKVKPVADVVARLRAKRAAV